MLHSRVGSWRISQKLKPKNNSKSHIKVEFEGLQWKLGTCYRHFEAISPNYPVDWVKNDLITLISLKVDVQKEYCLAEFRIIFN